MQCHARPHRVTAEVTDNVRRIVWLVVHRARDGAAAGSVSSVSQTESTRKASHEASALAAVRASVYAGNATSQKERES